MRIADVLAVPVQAGFFFDDQLAIRAGAGHDGFDYTGEPLIPGFRRVRQPGEAVSVLLVLDDGGDEGLMIVGNEMARTAALVRAREAVRHARA